MKKISLKNLDSLGIEKMSKNDLKKVIGGSSEQCGMQAGGALCPNEMCCSQYGYCGVGSDHCGAGCQSNCGGDGGSCGFILIGNNYSYHECGVSRDRAQSYAEAHIGYTHGYWCCESCSTTSYCGG